MKWTFVWKWNFKSWITDLPARKKKKKFQALLEKVTEVILPHGKAEAGPYSWQLLCKQQPAHIAWGNIQMMDSATDESSPHPRSNLTPLIVTNTIRVSSLSYCTEPVGSSRSSGLCSWDLPLCLCNLWWCPMPELCCQSLGERGGDGGWVWALGSAEWPASGWCICCSVVGGLL